MGPISKKVIAGLKKAKNRKIIDFKEIKEAKIYAQDLENSVISEANLSKYDPLHAVYIYAQNKVSVLVEQLSGLPALLKLTNTLAKANDIYLPSAPPKSPLTQSYFTCWGFFDFCVGIKKESFGTIILDLLNNLKADPGLITIIECMQKSRMGIYQNKGIFESYVILEELVTGKEVKAIVPSGYMGRENEIWFVRVMPEPFSDLNYGYSVVFTTPYVLSEMQGNQFFDVTKERWETFFDRILKKIKQKDKLKAYDTLMKYGLNKYFWSEYIFEGYVNFREDMIMLAGFPDIPLSLPHSKESQDKI